MKNVFKRIISIALICLLSLCIMCGCRIEHPYKSFYETEDVAEISIVIPGELFYPFKIPEDGDFSKISYSNVEIIKTLDVSYFDEIVADISSLKFYSYWGDPSGRINEIAIMIRYKNGHSDFISAKAWGYSSIVTNRDGSILIDPDGWSYLIGYEISYCDEPEKMQAIIDKWMNM